MIVDISSVNLEKPTLKYNHPALKKVYMETMKLEFLNEFVDHDPWQTKTNTIIEAYQVHHQNISTSSKSEFNDFQQVENRKNEQKQQSD